MAASSFCIIRRLSTCYAREFMGTREDKKKSKKKKKNQRRDGKNSPEGYGKGSYKGSASIFSYGTHVYMYTQDKLLKGNTHTCALFMLDIIRACSLKTYTLHFCLSDLSLHFNRRRLSCFFFFFFSTRTLFLRTA